MSSPPPLQVRCPQLGTLVFQYSVNYLFSIICIFLGLQNFHFRAPSGPLIPNWGITFPGCITLDQASGFENRPFLWTKWAPREDLSQDQRMHRPMPGAQRQDAQGHEVLGLCLRNCVWSVGGRWHVAKGPRGPLYLMFRLLAGLKLFHQKGYSSKIKWS